MTPFLPTLLTIALAEVGNGVSRTSGKLVGQPGAPSVPLAALSLVAAGSMVLAACGAVALHVFEPNSDLSRARALLLGLGLVWAAAGQFRTPQEVSVAEGGSGFVVALRSYARAMFTNRSGMVVFGIALIAGGRPIAALGAALGGCFGLIAASLPPLLLTRRQFRKIPMSSVRLLAGLALAIGGFYYLLQALGLL